MAGRTSFVLVTALLATSGLFACSNGADDEQGATREPQVGTEGDSTAQAFPSSTEVRASVSQLPGCEGEGLRSDRCFESMRDAVQAERNQDGKSMELVEDVESCVDEVLDYAWPGEAPSPSGDGLDLRTSKVNGIFTKICRWL